MGVILKEHMGSPAMVSAPSCITTASGLNRALTSCITLRENPQKEIMSMFKWHWTMGTNKTLQRTWLDGWLLDHYRPIEGLAVPIITDAILEGDVNSVPASFTQPSVSHITCACERNNDNLNLVSLKVIHMTDRTDGTVWIIYMEVLLMLSFTVLFKSLGSVRSLKKKNY